MSKTPIGISNKSDEIINFILHQNRVSSKELVARFKVSIPTVYKIFNQLKQAGKLRRIHGGAVIIQKQEWDIFDRKLQHRLEQKKAICAYAAKHFLKEEDTIAIDCGTTAYHLVDYIEQNHITIITNGLRTGNYATQKLPHVNVMCSGGTSRSMFSVCVGDVANNFFKNLYINTLFLTCSGIELPTNTIYELDVLIADMKRSMIAVSNRIVLLITSDKINMPSLSYLTDISSIDDVVCDDTISEETYNAFQNTGPKIHICKPPSR